MNDLLRADGVTRHLVVIDHIKIGVNDTERSRVFYTAAVAPLRPQYSAGDYGLQGGPKSTWTVSGFALKHAAQYAAAGSAKRAAEAAPPFCELGSAQMATVGRPDMPSGQSIQR